MPDIILDGKVISDQWQRLDAEQATNLSAHEGQAILVPLSCWNQNHASLAQRPQTGIWLASDELPEQIEGDWLHLPLVAVDFPLFADGRGFSIGRLLRQRYHFEGELRAVGSPIRDQLSYLIRCGFNAIQLAEHYDPAEALASLKDFSEFYQTAVDQETPLFRRRQA